MSSDLIAAARQILERLDDDGPWTAEYRKMLCRLCSVDLATDYHADDCPWLQMPAIVAALEQREMLREAADGLAHEVSLAMIVTDCNEPCGHPACHIIRALARYRRAAAATAPAPEAGGEA